MADQKLSTNYYGLLGGVNAKVSDYTENAAQFQDLKNLDFFVPNALSKRPGSTQAVSPGTSGPITSLFEFEKLDGSSYVIAGSDTAMFYLAANSYTLLSAGWNNGQPTDMLTFVNKLWMANGQKWQSWDGSTATTVGLPMQKGEVLFETFDDNGASMMKVGGATALRAPFATNSTFIMHGIYIGYAYVRSDGYIGPADFVKNARNIVTTWPSTTGDEWTVGLSKRFTGISLPAGYAYSAIALYVAVDTITNTSATMFLGVTLGTQRVGNLGYITRNGGNFWLLSETLIPSADVSRFHFFTTIPIGSLFVGGGFKQNDGIQFSALACTFFLGASAFDSLNTVSSSDGFSGMTFDFFATFTAKYLEQNNNVMFMGGFSSQPSTVQFSEIGEPEFTQPDYNFEIRTNDGDKLSGLKTYNSTVVATKERSFAKIIGSTPDDLQVVELSTEYGNLSNKSMVEYDQKLGWLDRRGWLEYNGSTWNIISGPVEPIFRRMNLSAAREKACAVNHQYRSQVWIGIPIDGSTTNNLTVVYDYLVGAWTFFDGFNASSFALIKGPLTTPTVWQGDYSGIINYFGESFFGDNGRGITCLGIPNWETDRGQQSTSVWRRFFLDVASNSSGVTGQIKVKIFSNYDASTVQATFAMYQNQFQSRADFGVVGKAVTAEFAHHSASLPLLIPGFSWTKRFLRNV